MTVELNKSWNIIGWGNTQDFPIQHGNERVAVVRHLLYVSTVNLSTKSNFNMESDEAIKEKKGYCLLTIKKLLCIAQRIQCSEYSLYCSGFA